MTACGTDPARTSEEGTRDQEICASSVESIQKGVFSESCAMVPCHASENPAARLDLSSNETAQRLVGIAAGTCDGWSLVVPGSPEESLLWLKLSVDTPPCGERMPVGTRLSTAELGCIEDWIRAADRPECESCGGVECLDLNSDREHCGSCKRACPAGASCEGGVCTCDGDLDLCGASCVDLTSSREHCGACGAMCLDESHCDGGKCVCSVGLEECGSRCAELSSDPDHCGACGNACDDGDPVCLLGTCAEGCGALTQCGQACIDTQRSASHCGACGNACASGATCVDGACRCPTGTSECDGSCIDTSSDPKHCGSWTMACASGQTCLEGTCECPNGSIVCGGSCTDVRTDARHCGGCGASCGGGQTCTDGMCLCSADGPFPSPWRSSPFSCRTAQVAAVIRGGCPRRGST